MLACFGWVEKKGERKRQKVQKMSYAGGEVGRRFAGDWVVMGWVGVEERWPVGLSVFFCYFRINLTASKV